MAKLHLNNRLIQGDIVNKNQRFSKCALAIAVASLFPITTYAADLDPETRIKQLEQMMQQMQQQRAEQDKQIELLTKELVGIEQQVSQSKIVKSEEKGKSEGSPVYAAFKDGLVFDDASGNWKLQINGRIQADYRDYADSDWRKDTFSIRRARFGGTFTFLKDYAVRVEGEYANANDGSKGTTALTYGYLDINWWKQAKIRIGQFKPFFGLERPFSTNFTDFTELSLATNNGAIFNSTYDRGIMVFGDPLPWVNYNVYAVNGTGQNNDELNNTATNAGVVTKVDNTKDVGLRVNANLAKLLSIENTVIHVGASYSDGSVAYSSMTGTGIAQSTEANGVSFFNVAGLQNADADRKRQGIETALSYGPVKLQSEYIVSNLKGTRTGVDYDNDIKAWYVNLNWMLTGESYADSYKSGVFGRMKPKNNMTMAKDGWGAWELGLRYSKFDASDFENMLPIANAGTAFTAKADAWTAGVKWIMNPNARIMLNYIRTDFDTPITVAGKQDDREDAIVMRAQYDF
ncbi:porin [Methylovorus sp. MM2]|uniref:OprO/OprP family phosphate-selective porin n=1 Tax=Methylovorus sp. MM2 TaxID=1848038 RepID=UPI0007E05B2B|nr:porin [Methylovorus sp. MM2]OAM52299.1 porin [Methylovorus sp. MM2]